MSKIINNYIYNTSYQLLAIAIPLLTAPYLSRVLGAEQLGIYGYVTSISSIFATIGLFGIYSYGNRETAYNKESATKLNETFWEIMIIRLIFFIITGFIYLIIIPHNIHKSYFYIYSIWLVSNFIDVSWFFVGLENMKPAAIKNSFSKLVTLIGIFMLVKTEKDLWIYLLLISVSTLISNISVYPLLKLYIKKPKLVDYNKMNLCKHLKGSLHLFLPQAVSVVYLQMDKVMIEEITGITSDVGYYLQAEKIINLPLALIAGLSTVMMPRIANEFKKGNLKNINKLLVTAAEFSAMAAIPMTIGLIVISQDFVEWFLGKEFLPSSVALVILSPLLIINSLGGISNNQYFMATNQIGLLIKTNMVAAVFNVLLNMLLIPKYSFVGAAYASVISLSTSIGIQYYFMSKQISISKIISSIVKYSFFSLIMGIAIQMLRINNIFGRYTFLWQILLGVLFYILLLKITNDKIFLEITLTIKKRLFKKGR